MIIERIQIRPDEVTGPDISHRHFRTLSEVERDELLEMREQICSLLEVRDFIEARQLVSGLDKNSKEWNALNTRICSRMCHLYDESVEDDEAVRLVRAGMQTVNKAMSRYTDAYQGYLKEDATTIGEMSGAYEQDSPLALLGMVLDVDTYSKEIRFESARKLEMGIKSVEIHVAERKIKTSDQVKRLIELFNSEVWNGSKIGSTDNVEIISSHDPLDFHCKEIEVLGPDDKTYVDDYRIYHKYRMRRTKPDSTGKQIKAMFEYREKDDGDILLKMLRRNLGYEKMNDRIGLRLVFQNKEDIPEFLNFLTHTAQRLDKSLEISNFQDTIENGVTFKGQSQGSSNKLEVVKAKVTLDGVQFELQMHTLRTYIDYNSIDTRSHDEYTLARQLIQLGSLFFPHAIYGIDLEDRYGARVYEMRELKRNTRQKLPPKRSMYKSGIRNYGLRRLDAATDRIIKNIHDSNWSPKIVIGDIKSALLASRLAAAFKCRCELVDFDKPDSLAHVSTDGQPTIIATNITNTGLTLNTIKSMVPEAKTAVLVNQSSFDVDFVGESEFGSKVWYNFTG